MKVYVVLWGSGSCDDHYNAHAYCGVHGIYHDKALALNALVECKDETYNDILNAIDPDGEFPELAKEVEIMVYGSEAEEYFEIDYTLGTEPCEVYIKLEEKEFN
jgi:hypothetical protein